MSTGQSHIRRSISAIVVLTVLVLAVEESAQGQAPTIQPRQIAAFEQKHPDCQTVWEPHVAIGATRVVTVFNDWFFECGQITRVGYAVFNLSTRQWTSRGQIDPNRGRAIDPSIAYEPAIAIDGPEEEGAEPLLGNNFLAAALVGGDLNALAVARFNPQTEEFGPWHATLTLSQPPGGDKPWLVRGELLPSGWEYYITLWAEDHYLYVRSVDSGQNWFPNNANDAIIRVGEEVVRGLFCAQPAVRGSGPLYVAIRDPENAIRILQGTDRPDGGVDFGYLRSAGGVLVIPRNRSDFSDCFPVYPRAMGESYTVSAPQLAVDPNDPNRLYLAYQDTASDSPADRDVNIYSQLVRKTGPNVWVADPRVLVNDDETLYESDQCLPQLTARPGWIEIAFYDDRKYEEQDDGSDNPKLDVFYAISRRDSIRFDEFPNQELCARPLDCAQDDPANHFVVSSLPRSVGEYFGIDARGRRSFVVFCGTHPYPNPTDYILWGTEIIWQP